LANLKGSENMIKKLLWKLTWGSTKFWRTGIKVAVLLKRRSTSFKLLQPN